MREIKFRVWDTDKQRFIWTGFANFISETHQDKPQDVRQGRMVLNADYSGMGTRCVFQEFSGIQDKNGNEIYEGDYIKLANGEIVRVHFMYGSFVGVRKNGTTSCSAFYWIYSEITGNTYETPELT